MRTPTALIAEDEPVLAQALRRQLTQLWPDLQVKHMVGDGQQVCELAPQHLPDILFLDIHMPLFNGLEAAERVIDAWPDAHPLPLIVFITAYDSYAVSAFERAAIDYVLKPVRPERLALTCLRLQQQLSARAASAPAPPPPLRRAPRSARKRSIRTKSAASSTCSIASCK